MGDAALEVLRNACISGDVREFDRFLELEPDGLQRLRYARAGDNYALRDACGYGHTEVVERLLELGLTADDARACNNEALSVACAAGHLAVVERLLELGLTADDARAGDNAALRNACVNGHLEVLKRLLALGLAADDARADDNYALRYACVNGHFEVVDQLLDLGLTADDVRADNSYALYWACVGGNLAVVERLLALGLTADDGRSWAGRYSLNWMLYRDRRAEVCALAAAGVIEPATGMIEPPSVLHEFTLRLIIQEPATTSDIDEDARRAETRRAAARAAAGWPGHDEVLARLAKFDPNVQNKWSALYADAVIPHALRVLRFSD